LSGVGCCTAKPVGEAVSSNSIETMSVDRHGSLSSEDLEIIRMLEELQLDSDM
jgi:hypothetical protein